MSHQGNSKDWIQLLHNRRFYLFTPDPATLNIRDIAHGLALTNRFSGQCHEPYSVAQHSVLVSRNCDPADALWGLLHDASEAYLGDVATPLKRHEAMAGYREVERRMMAAVCERFDLAGDEEPESVRRADKVLLATEVRDLFDKVDPHWAAEWFDGADKLSGWIVPWDWRRAEVEFLERFRELVGAERAAQLGYDGSLGGRQANMGRWHCVVGNERQMTRQLGVFESVGAEATSSNYRSRDGSIPRS